MNSFFNPDNKVLIAIGHVGDYMLLSVIWFFCSIPIFTIGASTTALYYSSLKILDGEETYLFRDYFHSFKQNFKQATLLWLVFLVFGLFCALDLAFYREVDSPVGAAGFLIFLSITIMYTITLLYLFPFLSKFYCTFKEAIKSAFFLSVRHFGYTVLMVIGDVAVFLAAISFTFLLLFLPGLICFVNSVILRHIFKRYIPEKEKETDDFALITEIEERDAAKAAELSSSDTTAESSSETETGETN